MAQRPRVSMLGKVHRNPSRQPRYPYARNTWLDTYRVTWLNDQGLIVRSGSASKQRVLRPDPTVGNRIHRERRLGYMCAHPFAGVGERVMPSASWHPFRGLLPDATPRGDARRRPMGKHPPIFNAEAR